MQVKCAQWLAARVPAARLGLGKQRRRLRDRCIRLETRWIHSQDVPGRDRKCEPLGETSPPRDAAQTQFFGVYRVDSELTRQQRGEARGSEQRDDDGVVA